MGAIKLSRLYTLRWQWSFGIQRLERNQERHINQRERIEFPMDQFMNLNDHGVWQHQVKRAHKKVATLAIRLLTIQMVPSFNLRQNSRDRALNEKWHQTGRRFQSVGELFAATKE
eukprot:TRINITY_DN7001_c0_g1_i1.p2 TRINITY_DN7001_c0_g1~~TRINITY_DN7001_c0_g1_i1.p2  ORF type:complete len:115 (+),score=7.23 TRINITY_DN7001_c0_g1_i1:189-533(+)